MFVGHGSPLVAVEDDAYTEALSVFGNTVPKPAAIVVVSAHWEAARPLRVSAWKKAPLIYDFFGFPPRLYELDYPSFGSPALATKIAALLLKAGHDVVLDEKRGLDHGAWIPLRRMFPKADIPVLQLTLSIPRNPRDLMELGRVLSPLRHEGIFLIGSGNLIHNLRRVHFSDKQAPIDSWARELDEWLVKKFQVMDVEGLMQYREKAPHAELGAPTTEHFDPLFFVLGAGEQDPMTTLFDGFHYGNLSMRTFLLG